MLRKKHIADPWNKRVGGRTLSLLGYGKDAFKKNRDLGFWRFVGCAGKEIVGNKSLFLGSEKG
jgi:hypothetical protein